MSFARIDLSLWEIGPKWRHCLMREGVSTGYRHGWVTSASESKLYSSWYGESIAERVVEAFKCLKCGNFDL